MLINEIDPLMTYQLENPIDKEGNLVLQEDLLYFQRDDAPHTQYIELPARNSKRDYYCLQNYSNWSIS